VTITSLVYITVYMYGVSCLHMAVATPTWAVPGPVFPLNYMYRVQQKLMYPKFFQ